MNDMLNQLERVLGDRKLAWHQQLGKHIQFKHMDYDFIYECKTDKAYAVLCMLENDLGKDQDGFEHVIEKLDEHGALWLVVL